MHIEFQFRLYVSLRDDFWQFECWIPGLEKPAQSMTDAEIVTEHFNEYGPEKIIPDLSDHPQQLVGTGTLDGEYSGWEIQEWEQDMGLVITEREDCNPEEFERRFFDNRLDDLLDNLF